MNPNREAMIEQRCVDAWNEAYAVGAPVTVYLDSGEALETQTRSMATLLGGHTAVIWVDGLSACYSLHRVAPRECDPCVLS